MSDRLSRCLILAFGLAYLIILTCPGASRAEAPLAAIDLAGTWSFQLDPRDIGVGERWFARSLPDSIRLPSSTTEAGYGDPITIDTRWTGSIIDRSWFTAPEYAPYREPGQVRVPFWLSPTRHYVGAAWYRKEVIIPPNWAGKRITLSLERCHWQTRVWIDGQEAGMADSLATPHEHDLSTWLTPGKHTLALRVDNTVLIQVGENAHSVSDHTQSNWNGIVGAIRLVPRAPVFIEDLQVYPQVTTKTARVVLALANTTGRPTEGTVTLTAALSHPRTQQGAKAKEVPFRGDGQRILVETDYALGRDALLWDEFAPHVYTLTARATTASGTDTQHVDLGLRQLGVDGTQFTLNGRKIFLRGTLECCIFPLTGYPPTDVDSWTRILRIAKDHGLNHLRFHSWCPPEAAFVAADRVGFMYQIECCVWTTVGENPQTDAFIRTEGDRILKAYGNHPSFCLMGHGNEPSGKNQRQFLGELVSSWKQQDPRRLYTTAAGWPLLPQSDYHSTPDPRVYRWGEGLNCRLNARPPETMTDYRAFVARHDRPVISHEIGQWCVYPDFKETARYTGVLRALNFQIFRDSLAANHLLDQADSFLLASGKLQTLCYKEDIESALRTPGFGGFQLLDLHDFPGQGTALVGVLNPFWESKGYVTPEQYRRFCCETVPLARMAKRIWTADETFTAALEIAHFGPAPIENARPAWTITDAAGKQLGGNALPARTIPVGNGTVLGEVALPLAAVAKATKCVLTVSLPGTTYANDWDIWVYPPIVNAAAPDGVLVVDDLNANALAALKTGGRVLLLPAPGTVSGDRHGVVPPGFTSIFWNTAWTRRQPPHTLGILCKPDSPALAAFPTEYHSNWQWWDMVTHSQIMVLNGLPDELRPTVQVIDDWVTNRRLGLVFEAKVEGGRLLVCGIDLTKDLDRRPVARQMRHSLLTYMASDRFAPQVSVEAAAIQRLIDRVAIEVIKVDCHEPGYEGAKAVDGDPDTIWHTAWSGDAPGYPHEIQLKLARELTVRGLRCLPRQDMNHGWITDFEVFASSDPGHWGQPVAKGVFGRGSQEKQILFARPVKARFLRLVALTGIDNQTYASVAELGVIGE
ncbi:MAG: discoidin domain-containing protein [Phycisphaerae bacterium]|nr:discoidin domain-containing protein [Phycisphaerae bacterium]